MDLCFGIHVGNSSICLASCKRVAGTKGSVEVVPNQAGERVMPALVTIIGFEDVFGTPCKTLMINHWRNTIVANKCMLNKTELEGPSNGERKVKMDMVEGELVYELPMEEGIEYRTPEEIGALFYNALHEIASTLVPPDTSRCNCVLMIPPHFSEDITFKFRIAAETMGWDVKHVMNEACAPVLAYNLISTIPPSKKHITLVYRIGGRTCDVSVIEIKQGMMTILDSEHCENVGGRMILSAFTKYLGDEFYRKSRLDPKESHRALNKLMMAAESCIHVLSTVETSNLFVESLVEGVDFSYSMSRARFESLLFPFLPVFAKPIHDLLSRMNIMPNFIDSVLFCGGPMKIPRLKQYISSIFEGHKTEIASLPTGINYDEVLACGAALQCAEACIFEDDNPDPEDIFEYMDPPFEDMDPAIEVATLEKSITIKVDGVQENEPIVIAEGSTLPILEPLILTRLGDTVVLNFSQGDRETGMVEASVTLRRPGPITVEIDRELGMRLIEEDNDITIYHPVRFFDYVEFDD